MTVCLPVTICLCLVCLLIAQCIWWSMFVSVIFLRVATFNKFQILSLWGGLGRGIRSQQQKEQQKIWLLYHQTYFCVLIFLQRICNVHVTLIIVTVVTIPIRRRKNTKFEESDEPEVKDKLTAWSSVSLQAVPMATWPAGSLYALFTWIPRVLSCVCSMYLQGRLVPLCVSAVCLNQRTIVCSFLLVM